jgi:uncharacterized protein (DUF1501 family)
MQNLRLKVPAQHFADRKELLRNFDGLRREVVAASPRLEGSDAMTARALDMVTSSKVCDALDVSKEPPHVRDRYGAFTSLLQARRLVEAGVSLVSLKGPEKAGSPFGDGWDSHAKNFEILRRLLPQVDHAVHTLVTDLCDRGLDRDVCVVLWGEFGRTPKINKDAGRDHWGTGFVLFAGGGLKMGQVVGATDARAEHAIGVPYTSENVLATLYRVLGIDLETTLQDHFGRPHYLLEDRRPIKELV